MVENNSEQGRTDDGSFAHLRKLDMRKVEFFLDRGDYVDGADLAAALREQSGKPVPPKVLDYLCRYLEGKVAKPKGRKAIPKTERLRRQMLLSHYYRRYLAWLKKRRQRYGQLKGWPLIRRASWWRGPPSQRAARMAARCCLHGAESWRAVHNFISSRK